MIGIRNLDLPRSSRTPLAKVDKDREGGQEGMIIPDKFQGPKVAIAIVATPGTQVQIAIFWTLLAPF